VTDRDVFGHFTALTWFRGTRVAQLIEADKVRQQGRPAIVDSYYDVLLSSYLGNRGAEWLLSPDDPYFHVASSMAKVDNVHLPKADVLVFLNIQKSDWVNFLKARNRDLDAAVALAQNYHLQDFMLQACKQEELDHPSTTLVVLDQKNTSPEDTAQRVIRLLQET